MINTPVNKIENFNMIPCHLVKKGNEESCVFEPKKHSQVQEDGQQKNLFLLPFVMNPSHPDPQVKIGNDSQKEKNDESPSTFIIKKEAWKKKENISPSGLWINEWENKQKDSEKYPEINPGKD